MQIEGNRCYFVYITSNQDCTILETGSTGDLRLRLYELKYGLFKGTDRHHQECFYLLYCEPCDNAAHAVKRHAELDRLSMKRKIRLIETANPQWKFLNEEIIKGMEMKQ